MVCSMKAAGRAAAKARFLGALATGDTIVAATHAAGVNRRTLYRWRDKDSIFARAWRQAENHKEEASPLEAEALRRAVRGVEKPVFRGGEIVGHTTDYSDSMLMFLLKAHHPEKYDPKAVTTPPGNTQFDTEGAKDALFSKFRAAARAAPSG